MCKLRVLVHVGVFLHTTMYLEQVSSRPLNIQQIVSLQNSPLATAHRLTAKSQVPKPPVVAVEPTVTPLVVEKVTPLPLPEKAWGE